MELARTSKSTEVYNPLAEGFTGKDFKRQATSHVSAFKKALDHICNMFPKMPRTTIEEVLKRYKVCTECARIGQQYACELEISSYCRSLLLAPKSSRSSPLFLACPAYLTV